MREGSMKTLFQFLLAFCLVLVAFHPASGQITITASDVSAELAPGKTLTSHQDSTTKTANIGQLGSTSWDFSALHTDYNSTATTVSPNTTPYFSEFPSATHCITVGTIYAYYVLGTHLESLGFASSSPFNVRGKNTPAWRVLQLPMTNGTSWTSAYTDTNK
jgi:hypothetical protein